MGVDPAANYARFILKEQSIDVHRPDRFGTIARNESAEQIIPRGKVPHGTTKCTYKMGLSVEGKLNRNALGIES